MANEQSQSNAHKGNHKLAKTYNFFQQALTIAIVLFISKIIESFIPFPMPASVWDSYYYSSYYALVWSN